MRLLKFNEWNNDIMYKLASNSKYYDLIDTLEKYNVPLHKWGTNGYKTIAHLFYEIEEGETILKEENNELHRYVNFIGARILYKKNNSWYRLYEYKQVFKDGRVRRRDIPYSMAEKSKADEDPKIVIIRGLKEELKLDVDINQTVYYNTVKIENNNDYPGIKSFHTGKEFLVILNDEQYNPDGYIEEQSDKNVYFEWRKVNKK